MGFLVWKNYKGCGLATFVSVLGAMTIYGGIGFFVNSLIPAGIICVIIGLGLHWLADNIAKKKLAKKGGNAETVTKINNSSEQIKSKTLAQQTDKVNPKQSSHTANTDTYAAQTVKCNACGKMVEKTNSFCTECGNSLIIKKSPVSQKCRRCGIVITETSKFCPDCGYELKR